jgi:hypothetical protein
MIESDLLAQIVIGRFGELSNWWDSEALSAAGRSALQRLLPRTWPAQAVVLNGRAAILKHKGLIRTQRGFTLFGRLDAADPDVSGPGEALELSAAALEPLLDKVDASTSNGLESLLINMEVISHGDLDWLRDKRVKPQGSSIPIGKASLSDLENRETRGVWVRRLAAAYTLSSADSLCAPFLEIA